MFSVGLSVANVIRAHRYVRYHHLPFATSLCRRSLRPSNLYQRVDETLGSALNATRDRYAATTPSANVKPSAAVRRAELWDRVTVGCCTLVLCVVGYMCGMTIFQTKSDHEELYDRYGRRIDPETHMVKPRLF